jgi:hypothetical protein
MYLGEVLVIENTVELAVLPSFIAPPRGTLLLHASYCIIAEYSTF